MTISTGTILRVVATALWTDGNTVQNVFNVTIAGGGGPWDEADVVDDCLDWVENMYANMVTAASDELDGSQVQVYERDVVGDDWDEIGSTPWVWTPTVAGDYLPRGVAALINAKSTNADVSGKKYLGGLPEANCTEGLWVAATVVILAAFGVDWSTAFVGATTAADFLPAIWSTVDKTAYPMTGIQIVPTIPAYQRRRKRGVGI